MTRVQLKNVDFLAKVILENFQDNPTYDYRDVLADWSDESQVVLSAAYRKALRIYNSTEGC
jgi:hypothetical protein